MVIDQTDDQFWVNTDISILDLASRAPFFLSTKPL
jgi:hypothetical protein